MNKLFSIVVIFCLLTYTFTWAQNPTNTGSEKIIFQEKVNFENWPNCVKLSNGNIELIVTTDIGPRIIRFGFVNGPNIMYVSPTDKGKTGGNDWRLYGGQRFWHGPEAAPRSYSPDNSKIKYAWNGTTLKLVQDVEPTTGIVKEMEITLSATANEVTVLHRMINKNLWAVELAPWAIASCAAGGHVIVPQEPYIDSSQYFLPARPIVIWYEGLMADPRIIWGNKYIQVKHDSVHTGAQKIGVLNKQRWGAYWNNNNLFIKKFSFDPNAQYTDYGCNNEVYVNGDFIELETLGPFVKIAPQDKTEHTEHWLLSRLGETINEDEITIEKVLTPIVKTFLETGK